MCIMKVGDTFSSYEEFNNTLSEYKKRTYNEYWIRDARTIENQRKRHPDTVVNAKNEIKYYYLVVACVKGGRKFQSRDINSKRNCSTSKQDCSAAIYLHLSKCKQLLTLTKINEHHNHKSSLAYFSSLSKQRLNQSFKLKEDVRKVLVAGAMKKHVLEKNISSKNLKEPPKSVTTPNRRKENKKINDCVKMLKSMYKCDVEVFKNEDGINKALFFQDSRMKQYFEAFPEVLFIDGTHCLVDMRTATYIIMVEDGNGLCEIVAVCFLMQENEESIEFFMESFKKFNPTWENIQVIMSDKDNFESDVFKKHFPGAKFMFRLCKVFQIFNKDISSRKMSINSKEVKISKEYLQKIAYSSSESQYKCIYEKMMDNVPTIVQTYYQNNWANITEQWVKYLTCKNLCLFNSTNNCLESILTKLKSIINSYSLLDDFFNKLFAVINSYRIEKDIKNSRMLYKKSVKLLDKKSAEHSYGDLLTTFAFEKVKKQLELSELCKEFNLLGNYTFIATTSEGLLKVTVMHCGCTFRTSTMLPCRHIFRCRTLLSLPLFDENLCLPRWTKSYFDSILNVHEINNENKRNEEENRVNNSQMKHLTKHEKYKLMEEQGSLMARMCKDVSTPIFYERLNMIKRIINDWKDGPTLGSRNTFDCDHAQQEDYILPEMLGCDSESRDMDDYKTDEEMSESHNLTDNIEILEANIPDDPTPQLLSILRTDQPKEIENTELQQWKKNSNIKNCFEENYLEEEYLEEDLLE